jgi:hypothetical protein
MDITRELIKGIYDAGNAEYWHNLLPNPRIIISPVLPHDFWALWSTGSRWRYSTVRVSSAVAWDDDLLVRVVLHEQIHVAQSISHLARVRREQHGAFFQYHHERILGSLYNGPYA